MCWSTDPHGTAGNDALIPATCLKESVRFSKRAGATDTESVAIYFAIIKGSEQQRHLDVFTDCQDVFYRLTAFSPQNMVTRDILHQNSRLSKQGIRLSLYWIHFHLGISACDKVDQFAKLALTHEEP